MNIIKRKSDNVVIFRGSDLILDENGCSGKGWKFNKIPSADLVLESVSDIPEDFIMGMWTYASGMWALTAAGDIENNKEIATNKSDALLSIDKLSDDIVTTVIGRRDTEYLMAEQQAKAYIDAGYKGDTYPYVDSWAQAKSSDQKWAADNIIETAGVWRAAQSDMRKKRLKSKEDIRNATATDQIDNIVNIWVKDIGIIKQQLGI